VIEVVAWLVFGALLVVAGVLAQAIVGDLRGTRAARRVRERERPLRHIRTLEQELGLEPYPLGPLDAPDVPTASPVRRDTVARELHEDAAEVYRAQLLRRRWPDV
jgi:hypothetical protein